MTSKDNITFNREELRQLKSGQIKDETHYTYVLQQLLTKLEKEPSKLSTAERIFVCEKLPILYSIEENTPLDPFNYPECTNVLFIIRDLLYFNNVNGWYPAKDWNKEITGEEKERDINLLNKHYSIWKEVINKTNHSDSMLQNICKETRDQIRQINKYCDTNFIGNNRRDYILKSFILHSKFMYFLILEYYEENEEVEILKIGGNNIRIDSYSFIHIMFRQYAKFIKEHQAGKSYHNSNIDYLNIPQELLKILKAYDQIEIKNFNRKNLYFMYKEKIFNMVQRDYDF